MLHTQSYRNKFYFQWAKILKVREIEYGNLSHIGYLILHKMVAQNFISMYELGLEGTQIIQIVIHELIEIKVKNKKSLRKISGIGCRFSF